MTLASVLNPSPLRTRLAHMARFAVLVAVLGYLGYRLSRIGWGEIAQSLPVNPAFYLLFIAVYLTLPLSETFVYRKIWGGRVWPDIAAFIRKRVLNEGVMGYSGEAYLFFWARSRIDLPAVTIATRIKDNNVLSSVVSTTMMVVMTLALISTGVFRTAAGIGGDFEQRLYLAVGFGGLLTLAFVALARRIISLPQKTALIVLSIHLARYIAILLLQTLQWWSALPNVPIHVWLLLLVSQSVLTRIPFMPSYDLVFLGVGLSLAGVVNAPETEIAAMLLTGAALSQAANLVAFLATGVIAQRRPAGSVGAGDEAAPQTGA